MDVNQTDDSPAPVAGMAGGTSEAAGQSWAGGR